MKIYSFIILSTIKLSISKSAYNKKDHDSRSIEGDTLIDKILSSDKFNELADKIVDKALAKFKNKKSNLGLTIENMEKISTPEFKSNKDKISTKAKRKNRMHKIDVDAVLQKKALSPGNLSFRYEHFTKIVTPTTEKSDVKMNYDYRTISTDAKVENINKNPVKQEHSSKSKYHNDEKSKSDKDDDSRSKEQHNSNENINTDLSLENVTFNEKPKSGELEMVRPQSGVNQFGDEKTIHWNGTEDDSKESSKNTTDSEKKITEPAPEIFNRADDENQSVSDDEQLSDASQEAGHEETKKRKRKIRREGDKIFTLNESPDYAEYHEKVAELRKNLGTKIR